jgi:hypothetical protein
VVFVFEFVYMLDYVNEFPYVGPSLHPWNEAFLLMMDDCFDVFLDLVCENFIEYFYIDSHKGNWSEFLFLFALGIRVIMTSQNELGSVCSVSIL